MDITKKQYLLNRISSGITFLEIDGTLYKSVLPTQEQKALADMVYNKTIEDNLFSDLMRKEDAFSLLNSRGIWTEKDEQYIKDLNKYLEDLKVELFNSLYNKDAQKKCRKQIESVNNTIEKKLSQKHYIDSGTMEYYAEKCKQEFLLGICIIDVSTNVPVYTYENFHKKSNCILNRFLNNAIENILSIEEYREIARTEPFRSLWLIGKENVFNRSACDLSMDQKTLILYSRMYDNVYENPDRPSEDVIADDDMLDGWFIQERRKQEKERKQKEVDIITNHNKAGGELFIMARNNDDAQKIRDLNDLNSKIKMKQREEAVQSHGKLEEHQLPDVQIELRREAMKQMAEKFKRK